MKVVELKSVNYQRSNPDTKKKIDLKDINLTIEPGDFVYLKGETGAGKSTIIDFFSGHKQPDSGEVKLFEDSPGKIESRLKTGVAFQRFDSSFQQQGLLDLLDLIESHYPGGKGKTRSFLKEFELELSNYQYDLSGGQQQLLGVSISQCANPKLLILDEPTTGLDSNLRPKLCQKLNELASSGTTILFTTQIEQDLTELNLTKTIHLQDGKLTEIKHRELYPQPSKNEEPNLSKLHWLKVFRQHIKFNLTQTWQKDRKYLSILFAFSIVYAIIVSLISQINRGINSDLISSMVNAYSLYLGVTALTSTGSIIALERPKKFWIKLINILPLPPFIYLSAKLVTSLAINAIQIFVILGTTAIINGIFGILEVGFSSPSNLIVTILSALLQYFSMALGFILGTIPYLSLGLTLGYFSDPKSVQILALITSFSLFLPLYVRQLIEVIEQLIQSPDRYNLFKFVGDNMAAHSPTYHYIQMVLGLGNSPAFDRYMWVHIFWLFWFAIVTASLSLWTYHYNFKKMSRA